MYRYDVRRSAHMEQAPSGPLQVHWERALPAPRRAWPWQADDFEKLSFDRSYEPVASGGLLYLGSMVDDTIRAYDLDTGEERWRHVTDGPVHETLVVSFDWPPTGLPASSPALNFNPAFP